MSAEEITRTHSLKIVEHPTPHPALPALPIDHLERVESWGMNAAVLSYVFRPTTTEGIAEVFSAARSCGRTVALRGGGRSYGDASLGAENITLDLSRMNRILAWSPDTGVITVEPGVTLRQLWQYVIGDGWWPPVVSGTMFVTMGGAAGMNYHGKNNFKMGPLGDHVLQFTLLTPGGSELTCSPAENRDLFYSALGGFGMLGCFTSLTLQMKHVSSGLVEVLAFSTRDFAHIIAEFEERRHTADYLVGWIDCFATGSKLGRGLVHQARYLEPGEDPNPAQTLRVESQELPDTMFGLIPKSIMWRLMKPFSNPLGMRLINHAKYTAGATIGNGKKEMQSHAGFAFLLDYVPNWKWAYRPGGLIQYQSFVPAETAERCFTEQLHACHEAGCVPWLGVFKRHKRDSFLMTHSVDGYSFALDLPIRPKTRERVWALAAKLNRIVVDAGGRFYFAKDSTLDPVTAEAYLGAETIDRFFALKKQCDPDNILQTDLAKRIFGTRLNASPEIHGEGTAMRILVTGANGMLGLDLCALLQHAGHQVVRTDTDPPRVPVDAPAWEHLDIVDTHAARTCLLNHQPDVVIHTAAFTDVDGCERDPDRAFQVNAFGTWNIASICGGHNMTMVYISTDFVFDGEKREPYTEFDTPHPLSHYGASKLAGERYVAQLCRRHFITRTSWLFGVHGRSFPNTILELAKTRTEIPVVSDEVGSPTHTMDLARTLGGMIHTELYGTYHVANAGQCSRCEMAKATLELAGIHTMAIKTISSSQYPSPTRRPAYSVLRRYALEMQGRDNLPPWKQALSEYLALRGAAQS